MKSLLVLAAFVAFIFSCEARSQPGPILGSTCPCGWSACRSNSDCGQGGCCFALSPHLPARCCAHRQYLTLLQSRGVCPRPSEPIRTEDEELATIGTCAPRYPPPKGAVVACPYMLPSDDCRTDEDCPVGPGNIPLLCCPTDLRPGCYIGKRCSSPILH